MKLPTPLPLHRLRRPGRRGALSGGAFAVALVLSASPVAAFVQQVQHDVVIGTQEYKAANGSWSTFEFPEQFRVNAIHAALLKTGKVLIVAGSGNDQESFDAGTFKTVLWDPATDQYTQVPTPADLFCSGHAFLPNGDLVVAGGTQRYELLEDQVTHASGAVTLKNENPHDAVRTFPKGTRLVGPNGKEYETTNEAVLGPATKTELAGGGATVTASETVVWVQAVEEGDASVLDTGGQFSVEGLTGQLGQDVYGMAEKMTMDKQDFQGLQTTYVFSPETERYERVGDMAHKRWYPTITPLEDGTLLASSGLDGTGEVVQGQTEVYDPATATWTERPDLTQYFPTYPWLYPMADGRLFYSGSNAGYGPADKGRQPGIWDLETNTLTPVHGLEDADQLETSASVMLPPVQMQTAMVVGGGGVGESELSTARTALVDLTAQTPSFRAGPDLQAPTRYPNVVNLPDDTVLITGGSKDYRGKGLSDNLLASVYHPSTGAMQSVASPSIGRDYHSEGILLPDGRVVVMGSNPLFADADDTIVAPFEQRLEIYSPSYLFKGERPVVDSAPDQVERGASFDLTTSGPAVTSARLMRPSAVTHATDVEQRTVALDLVVGTDGRATATVPAERGLVPDGWYMLFTTTADGIPSVARWVHVQGGTGAGDGSASGTAPAPADPTAMADMPGMDHAAMGH